MISWLKKRWWLVLIILLILGGWGLSRGHRETAIQTAQATKKDISRTVLASGKLVVPGANKIYSPQSGSVSQVLVSDGATVTKGEVILQLADGVLKSAVDQAQASLLKVEDADQQLKKTYVSAATKASLQTIMDNAGDALTRAENTYNADKSATNKAALEVAQNAHKTAEANYQAALAAEPTPADLEASTATITAAKSALAEAERNYNNRFITAPADGKVSWSRDSGAAVSEGQTVIAGQLLATVSDPNTLMFEAEVDETTIPEITVGLATNVELDAFAGQTMTAKVATVTGRPTTNKSGSDVYLVDATLDTHDAGLREGMEGQAEFVLETSKASVTVPAAAVIVDNNEDVVMVVKDGTVKRQVVEVGIESATETQITSGLSEGDEVVTSNNVRDLKDGQTVKVQN